MILLTCQTKSYSKFTIASPDSKLICVPICHGIVKIDENIIQIVILDNIQIPPKIIWTVILDTALELLGSIDQNFNIGTQPYAKANQAFCEIAFSQVKILLSSKDDEHTLGLFIKVWENIKASKFSLKSQNIAPKKLSKFAQILGNQPQSYIQIVYSQITKHTLPTISVSICLICINGDYHDSHQVFTSIEIF